jgi:hypothetical protein
METAGSSHPDDLAGTDAGLIARARNSSDLARVRLGPMAGALPTEFQLQLAYRQFRQRALPRDEAKRIARLSKRVRKKKEKVKLEPLHGPRKPRTIPVRWFPTKAADDAITAFIKATTIDIPRVRFQDEQA